MKISFIFYVTLLFLSRLQEFYSGTPPPQQNRMLQSQSSQNRWILCLFIWIKFIVSEQLSCSLSLILITCLFNGKALTLNYFRKFCDTIVYFTVIYSILKALFTVHIWTYVYLTSFVDFVLFRQRIWSNKVTNYPPKS